VVVNRKEKRDQKNANHRRNERRRDFARLWNYGWFWFCDREEKAKLLRDWIEGK